MTHEITLAEATAMINRYATNRETILAPTHQNQDILAISETLPRQAIESLLQVTGCSQMRIYYGMDEGLKVHAILVAVDAAGKNLLPPATAYLNGSEDDGVIIERAIRCPPLCPDDADNPFMNP
ncbi:hypothetical protein [Niabella aurantiaca]|uniref:hypothetical protein n=1 Tax=Niabella aurantiaca TaxID=379900 RepID=UPI000370572A|nr:hypothetical protein [Niabella aurantiaca]